MGAPRLEVDLNKIYHNTCSLITRLAVHGIAVTGVTKSALGSVEIAKTLLKAGVVSLGDSRIENIKTMRLDGQNGRVADAMILMIRSPMLSQVEQVIRYADMSCNTEIEIIKELSIEACKQDRTHQILLMIELGDLREGILPDDLLDTVREVLDLPNIELKGIGTNLACRSGVSPDESNMSVLSELADLVETTFDLSLDMVSGGNSANIHWALNEAKTETGRINNLRLGEAIFLGCEPLQRQAIKGLHSDAIMLVAEVIESKIKPSKPTGKIAQTAFGEAQTVKDRGLVRQSILAIGVQDVDPCGLKPTAGIRIMGASSDHLIIESIENDLSVGEEVTFELNYSALVRAMTSPFVSKKYTPAQNTLLDYSRNKSRRQECN